MSIIKIPYGRAEHGLAGISSPEKCVDSEILPSNMKMNVG